MSGIKPAIDCVTAVFCFRDEVLIGKRSKKLTHYPLFHSFPGGKVDAIDRKENKDPIQMALVREVKEELSIDLNLWSKKGFIKKIELYAKYLSPPVSPFLFNNHAYLIHLKEKFNLDEIKFNEEFESLNWWKIKHFLKEFNQGKILCVPPLIRLLKSLDKKVKTTSPIDLNPLASSEYKKKLIAQKEGRAYLTTFTAEMIKGIKQVFVPSNTLPPAQHTNCYILGNVAVDPSPKDTYFFDKLLKILAKNKVCKIFLTHHHPDHHEFAPQLAQKLKIPIQLSGSCKDLIEKKWGKNYFQSVDLEIIKDGQKVCTWMKKDVYALDVSGHALGHMALIDAEKTFCLVGDLIQGVGSVVIGGEGSSMIEYMQSLQKVIKLNPSYVLPSHGLILGGTQALENVYQHRIDREKEILNLWKKKPDIDFILEKV